MRVERAANQPIINERSREIVKNSAKYNQSIFTAERYDADIQRYREKRKFDPPVVAVSYTHLTLPTNREV